MILAPKIVTFVFAKYDSCVKDIFRVLILISGTLNSHPLSDGLTFLTIRSTLAYVIWVSIMTMGIDHIIFVYQLPWDITKNS
jgi:hypothetical protein